MKDYLKRLARGVFRYEDEQIIIEQNEIREGVCENSAADMSLTFSCALSVKGVIWSSNERVRLKSNMFSGTEGTIEYTVDCTGMFDGNVIEGIFDIVSNAGEYHLPYEFACLPNSLVTSMGKVSKMYDFTELARNAHEEALRGFVDERFRDVVLRGDDTHKSLYDLLIMNSDESEAIEEFLVATNQKSPVKISTDLTAKHFDIEDEDVQDTYKISKSTWGYTSVNVKPEPAFVTTNVTSDYLSDTNGTMGSTLSDEDFTGTICELGVTIHKDEMHDGINFGNVTLSTFNQKIDLPIEAVKVGDKTENQYRIHRNVIIEITKYYLNYRMRKITSSEWIEKTNKAVERVRGYGDTPYYKLIQAQIMIAMGQADECEWLLDSAREEINSNETVLYCYYLYISSLSKRDPAYTEQACVIIRRCFENGCDDWRVLWLLFYIDKQFGHNQSIKLTRIKDAYQQGCHSPVMYYEALYILNAQPVLLRVLNRFELSCIWYGCRNDIIEEPLAKHIAELIGAERVATLRMIDIAKYVYERFDTDENLTVLCSQLIRNGLYGKEYAGIYEKAILRGLRITRLYEYYIKSVSSDKYIRLPKIVLMFFSYDSGLDYKDEAFLYADIITNELDNEEICDAYRARIEQFGYEQIKQGNIDDNLLVIYRHIWSEKLIDSMTTANVIKLMFTYRIRIYSANIEHVLVKHKELKLAVRYNVTDGVAFVPMYTNGCSIVFEDANGHLHKDTIRYEKEKVLGDNSLPESLLEFEHEDELFDFYRFESEGVSPKMYELALRLKNVAQIEPDELNMINSWLIDYYNEFFEGDDFALHLGEIRQDRLDISEAVKLIEVCLKNELYTEAHDLIDIYGYSKVEPTLLFKYARHRIEILGAEVEENLVGICRYIFEAKKYNEDILKFMSDYFNGTNEQMYQLWKSCESFKVDTYRLEERLIAQALFTGERNGRLTEVFTSYYHKGGNKLIVDAYIAYNSYLYFVKHKKANGIVFTAIVSRLEAERNVQDVCKLALLKYWSTRTDELSEKEIDTASALINELCKENKCFEFFKKFADVLSLPYNILDQMIVEYFGNPEAKVCVNYRYSGEDEEHTEVMTVCGGVFVKSFTCFYGERVVYYFTEEYRNKIKESQVYTLTCSSINTEGDNGRFDYINDCIASRDLHDTASMRKLMHGYCVQNYVTQQYFKPL